MVWATPLVALLLLGALPGIAGAQPAAGVITTVAGNGVLTFNGDGIPATTASLYYPYDVTMDSAGNLYIADFHNYRIRRIDAVTGLITTVAGNGSQGLSPDGTPATQASLNAPISVAVDGAGNVYFSDYHNARVCKVDAATGLLRAVAGTGTYGYSGDSGPATAAELGYPWGIALNSAGDLFIADLNNYRVRKVAAATGIITTVAGTGDFGFSGDDGPASLAQLRGAIDVAVDGTDNLFVVDYNNHRVRKVTAATGIITTVAGGGVGDLFCGDGGPATAACLYNPYGVAADTAGNLLIADNGNVRVRYVDAVSGIITTVAGTGNSGYNGDGIAGTAASLYYPVGVFLDPAGNGYVGDVENHRIRMVSARTLPVITWADPARIVYGTALSARQLNATAEVAGVFVYDPAAGTVLKPGEDQTLSVTFTPDDLLIYGPATKTVLIDVQKAVAPVAWAVPAEVPPGTVLGAAQLNATSTLPGTFVYRPPAGTVVTATVQLFVVFTPDDAANYSNGGADVQLTVTGTVSGPPYTLTVTPATGGKIQGAGINCGAGGSACAVTMPASMTLGLSATASAGYTFTNWTGDCAGTTPSQWLSLAGPRSCSAVFTPVAAVYTLTIAPVPAGGTVTGNGLTCGTGGSTCAVTFGSATTATISAEAAAGYTFAGWGGACSGTTAGTTVLVDAAKTCTATFTASGGGAIGPPYTLTVTPPTGGKVQGAGINCGAGGTACSVTMPAAMTLGLSATASEGYTFTAWTGDCTGTNPAKWLSLNGPRTCGATFTATGGGGGTPEGGIITTFAGTGVQGFSGDGGLATAANLYQPYDVAVDGSGNLYISDYVSNRIRKVAAATGVITTVAGTGSAGFSGDGGPATAAALDYPYSVAADPDGNLYIADYGNERIRKVDAATGVITTMAGTGTAGYSGDGGPATAAELNGPFFLTADAAGNVYFSDLDNNVVRKVTAATGVITTVAGTIGYGFSGDGGPATAALLSSPTGVAVDGTGNLYISDYYNRRIRRVDAATGVITTVVGTGTTGFGGDGGPATAAMLDEVLDIAADASGNLYVSDGRNRRVRKVDAATGMITTVAGDGTDGFGGDGGPATAAQLGYPHGIDADGSGTFYIADIFNNRVRKVGAGSVAPVDGPPYTLTVTPPTGGKIQGAGINCGAGGTACSVTMPAQMTLGLAATPSAGYTFGGWTGHCTGSSPSLWLDLKGARTCSATFTAKAP